MIGWPTILPQHVLVSGFSAEQQPNAQAVAPELGGALVRARFTGEIEDIQCALQLEADKLQVLENFWKYDLKSGTLNFSWQHPISEVAAVANFLGRSIRKATISGTLFSATMQVQFVLR